MKTLYEVTNGWGGESYARCYVWAEEEAVALEMAREKFRVEADAIRTRYTDRYWQKLDIAPLFSEDSEPFATNVTDWGFDMPEEEDDE